MIDSEVAEALKKLEKSLHRRDVRGSRTAVDHLLADDFIEIGRSGRMYDKQQTLAALAAEAGILAVETDNFEFRDIAPGVVLLTYFARTTDDAGTRASLRGSLWKLIDGRWRMLLHQGTPTDVPRIESCSVIHVAPETLVGEVEQDREHSEKGHHNHA
jgi:hypothetical protein